MIFDCWKFRRTRDPAERGVTNLPLRTRVHFLRTLPDWAYPAACILICALMAMLPAKGGPLLPKAIDVDSSVYRYVGKVILAGGMPYRDTFDHKGPFHYLIQALGLSLGNQGIWVMGILSLLLTFSFFYKISRLIGCESRVACIGLICMACLSPYYAVETNAAESYALPFLSASIYVFLCYCMELRITRRQWLLCGFSCAAVLWIKLNLTSIWIVALLGIIADCARRKRFSAIFRHLFWFLAGFCALTLPVILWLCANRVFQDFIQDYLIFNSQFTFNGTSRPLLHIALECLYTHATRPPNLFAFGILLYLLMLRRRLSDAFLFLSYALNLVMISRSSAPYYEMILLPWIFYALSFSLMEASAIKLREKKRAVYWAFVLVSLLISVGSVAQNFLKCDTVPFQIAQVVKERTKETDSLSVCGTMDSVYLFSNRQSVSKYSYQMPVCFLSNERSKKMREEYFRDVEILKPTIIVLPSDFAGYERMKEITDKNYSLLESVGDVEIYALTG